MSVMTQSLYAPMVWPAWYSEVTGHPALVTDTMKHQHESPVKDLPTKSLKYKRMHDRQELYSNNKRCAGTQTTYTTWSESSHVKGRVPTHCVRSPTTSPMTTSPTEPKPLNLSPHSHRPSVICAPASNQNNTQASRREITTVVVSDPHIEEHFRRSLGENYPEYLSSASQTSPRSTPSPTACRSPTARRSPSPTSKMPNVLQTGSVDDHFAKSLGNTWTELQAKNKALELDILAGSVDDHFAKALGDKWLKIKADSKRKTPSPPPTSQTHLSPVIS